MISFLPEIKYYCYLTKLFLLVFTLFILVRTQAKSFLTYGRNGYINLWKDFIMWYIKNNIYKDKLKKPLLNLGRAFFNLLLLMKITRR